MKPNVKVRVGVDWGTSSLRVARFLDDGSVAQERESSRGILSVGPGEFPAVLAQACGDWLAEPGSVALVCGMAGSRQGWIEAPYCACPASPVDLVGRIAWAVPGRVAIVPGVQRERDGIPDVMRGEETQVFGALDLLGRSNATLVLPGTHSKWVSVSGGAIQGFSTFMTGEFYALLRKHSILARTLPPEDEGTLDESYFLRGVDLAMRSGNLLHASFSVRTLSLFDRLAPQQAPSYLSGLLVGEELRCAPPRSDAEPVIVVGSEALTARYLLGLRHLGIPAVSPGGNASWRGLWRLAQHLEISP